MRNPAYKLCRKCMFLTIALTWLSRKIKPEVQSSTIQYPSKFKIILQSAWFSKPSKLEPIRTYKVDG